MNVLPVISRELRAESRHAFTYWMRVLGAGAVFAASVVFVVLHGFHVEEGAQLFGWLHGTLQVAIWILVPLLTADCISRERREGTLGLLFLTPLKALDIVVAKSLAHGLRAVTLLLAAVPMTILPLLMGGVSWGQAASSLLVNMSALALALAAGLLATALGKSWVRSLILAMIFATTFALLYFAELGGLFEILIRRQSGAFYYEGGLKTGFQIAIGNDPNFFMSAYYYSSRFIAPGGIPTGPLYQLLLQTGISALLISLTTLFIAAMIAAGLTARNWQERPPHPLAVWFKNNFCKPVVMVGLLKSWMRRKLDRNPIGWLEQRSWSGRLVLWGWLAVMISVYTLLVTNMNFIASSCNEVHTGLAWVLLASMALNASTSLRRERETKVLELILVSPLGVGQIILGRLRGIWGQFLPSMAMLMCGWVFLAVAVNHFDDAFSSIISITAAFVAIPVIGLYFSILCRNFLTALISTAIIGVIVPTVLRTIAQAIYEFVSNRNSYEPIWVDVVFHPLWYDLILTGFFWWRLHRRLERRLFALDNA